MLSLFLLFFLQLFNIRQSDALILIIEINNDHFSPFKRFCQAPAYLVHGSLPNFASRGRLEDCEMNKPMLNTALNNFVKFKIT